MDEEITGSKKVDNLLLLVLKGFIPIISSYPPRFNY